jgi:phosphoserine phosphatase
VQAYIFDLDNTLINGNCSFKYFSFLNKKKVFSAKYFFSAFIYLIRYSIFNLSPTDLHTKVFLDFLKGRKYHEIFSFIDEFLDIYLEQLINPKVLLCLKEAKDKKARTILLSNSPMYLAQEIARRLKMDLCLGTTYHLDKSRRFVSIENIMDGNAKAKYTADLGEDISKRIVFTDSIWDRPLLDLADKCYLVNPDRKLSRLGKRKGWYFL